RGRRRLTVTLVGGRARPIQTAYLDGSRSTFFTASSSLRSRGQLEVSSRTSSDPERSLHFAEQPRRALPESRRIAERLLHRRQPRRRRPENSARARRALAELLLYFTEGPRKTRLAEAQAWLDGSRRALFTTLNTPSVDPGSSRWVSEHAAAPRDLSTRWLPEDFEENFRSQRSGPRITPRRPP